MASDSLSLDCSQDNDRPQASHPSLSRNLSSSRLNAKAAEFVPRSVDPPQQPPPFMYHKTPATGYFHAQPIQDHMRVPVQNHRAYSHHVPLQYHQPQQQKQVVQATPKKASGDANHLNKNHLTEEATQKIKNQVEYYFSDVNLATTDHLMRFINKDPDGYVPISVVSSFKKIKAFVSSTSQLAAILRNSAKLVISEDGKKVRRQLPLTDLDMEELQSRIVIAENLPEDHCHQNLMKIFSAVGSVKSIRTCQPQTSNGGSSSGSRVAKADGVNYYSNKLHAFVEYESVEHAERAVTELNEEGTWRNGLKVRVLHKHAATSAPVQGKKVGQDDDARHKDADTYTRERDPNGKHLEDPSQLYEGQSVQVHEHRGDDHASEKEGAQKKGRSRGRGKGRGRPQYHNNHNQNHRGNHVGGPSSVHPINSEHPTVARQPPGPRMPDGTRGFSMGRGKPVSV